MASHPQPYTYIPKSCCFSSFIVQEDIKIRKCKSSKALKILTQSMSGTQLNILDVLSLFKKHTHIHCKTTLSRSNNYNKEAMCDHMTRAVHTHVRQYIVCEVCYATMHALKDVG